MLLPVRLAAADGEGPTSSAYSHPANPPASRQKTGTTAAALTTRFPQRADMPLSIRTMADGASHS
jgi:hypothetical protein